MASQRLSAKEAIEALKAYQLKTVNASIVDEIQAIKKDLQSQGVDLDEVRRDIQKATEHSTESRGHLQKHGKTLQQLETEQKTHTKDLGSLQTSSGVLNERISDTDSALDAIKLHHEALLDELAAELTRLNKRLSGLEETRAQATDGSQPGRLDKFGRVDLEELEDRFDDFVQDTNRRFGEMQRDIGVPDSFPESHRSRDAELNTVDNAPPLTDHVHFISSPRQETNVSRWKPINPQIALQATPPPLPETIPFNVRQEDSYAETPSTLRRAGRVREVISNMAHTNLLGQRYLDAVYKQRPPSLTPRYHQVEHDHGRKHENENWKALTLLLKLRQDNGEILTQYLARFREITTQLGPGHDTISACLRRFVNGIRNDRTRIFVHEWLTTSDWTEENVQDCIVLLTRYCSVEGTTLAEPATVREHIVAGITAGPFNIDESPDPLNPASAVLNKNLPDPPRCEPQAPENLPREAEEQQRVQPARAAETEQVGTEKVSKKNHERKTKIVTLKVVQTSQQYPDEPPNSNEQVNPQLQTENTLEAATNKQDAQKQKGQRNPVGMRELQSLLDTRVIEKQTRTKTRNLKRKTLHRTEDPANDQVIREAQDPPPKRAHLSTKRVPKLVARSIAKTLDVSNTDDAVELPPMPTGSEGRKGESDDGNAASTARKRIRGAPTGFPILSLNSSDFQE